MGPSEVHIARLLVDGEEKEKEERICWCYQEIVLFGDGLDGLEGGSNPEMQNKIFLMVSGFNC